MSVDPHVLIGSHIDGRYRLASAAGTGSYGTVYAADEIAFGEVVGQVAVKLLRPPDDDARHATVREVQAMRQLSHPNILACYGAGAVTEGLAAGCLFIASELASHTLGDCLRAPERMAPGDVRELAEHIASALAYLCDRGAVHRDVKPANILRVGDMWKLGDLGLVRGFSGSAIQASGRRGTVLYMSPEALQGATGPFADVWAFGVVIQECLTGALAYSGGSDAEVIAAALTREPTITPNLPEPLGSIVSGCLVKDWHLRWTASRVVNALTGPVAVQTDPARRGIGALPASSDAGSNSGSGALDAPNAAADVRMRRWPTLGVSAASARLWRRRWVALLVLTFCALMVGWCALNRRRRHAEAEALSAQAHDQMSHVADVIQRLQEHPASPEQAARLRSSLAAEARAALALSDQAILLESRNEVALVQRAKSLYYLGRLSEAGRAVSDGLSAYPGQPDLLVLRSYIAERTRR